MGLRSYTLEDWDFFTEKNGISKFRGTQIFQFYHNQFGENILDCTVLPKDLRDELSKRDQDPVKILHTFHSKRDETKKFLFALGDQEIIEGVLMEYHYGLSQCVSTQVGCRMGCSFCASTKEGCVRNLTAGEIAGQVYAVAKKYGRVSHIILMGSGEPFDNYEEVVKFLRIIHDPKGQNISYRNITLSTCGVVPGILRFAEENLPVTLAISLHSPFDDIRETMMPITRKYSIEEVMKACKYYFKKTGRRVTFEYTLIDGINNRWQDGKELKKLIGDMPHHINLIPLNPIEEFKRKKPTTKDIGIFQSELNELGLSVTIRRELGGDINASCGQLRRSWRAGKGENK